MAFVPEAALIALREGLEALLITAVLLGLVTKLGRPDARKHVWAGFALAAATSVAAGWLIQRYVLDAFEEQGGAEWFELVAAGVAVVVLTYMIFWMWQHTRALMTTMRHEVEALLTRGALVSIALLTFASVLREGIEVVLFYGALSARASPLDLVWSGLIGLAASGAIAVGIMRGTARFNAQRFFAITGGILVFITAGLLVHSVHAATGLGLLEPAPAVWDTSGVIHDDSATGRVLHAVIGYTATPTLLQTLLYFGYVFGVGGAYLWSLGMFHRTTARGHELRHGAAVGGVVLLALVGAAIAYGVANPSPVAGHDDGDGHSHSHDDLGSASADGTGRSGDASDASAPSAISEPPASPTRP